MRKEFKRTGIIWFVISFLGFAVFALTAYAQQDIEGSKDHPLISRYPGSAITQYRVKDFDEYVLTLGKLLYREGNLVLEKTQQLEGKVTYIEYKTPKERSVLEIFRNYEMALKKAGFQTLFTCSNKAGTCGTGGGGGGAAAEAGLGYYGTGWESRYIAAKLARPEGDVYVALNVMEEVTHLNVVEVKPMEAGLVTVDAAAMAGDISRTGHVAVYGILFDFNKADVKPESEPALKEIAKLLKQDPKLKLHVVGHTDNVGDLKFNMDLSRRRADAVVKELTTKHGIAAARLRADGVGPLSPVASNKTEEGRAKNRRVELVEQ
jgi:outer membrane protein OmpA-like peptidoglycan-associated protein